MNNSEKFWKIMKTPLQELSIDEIEWALNQTHLNSLSSKNIFLAELNRRKTELQ